MWRSKRCYIGLLLFCTIFLGLFVRSSDASAVSDVVYHFDSSNTVDSPVFCGSYNNVDSGVSCSDFYYISVELSSVPSYYGNFVFHFNSINNFSSGSFLDCRFNNLGLNRSCIYSFDTSRAPSEIHSYSLTSNNALYYSYDVILHASPLASCSSPSGTLSITENGTFDVSSYQYAEVDVPAPVVTTPYDGKLDSLIQAVYVVAGTMLVIYFFYAMYRIYMGGKT